MAPVFDSRFRRLVLASAALAGLGRCGERVPRLAHLWILAHGFLRVRCQECGCERLVAYSCYLELKTIRSPREKGGVGKDER